MEYEVLTSLSTVSKIVSPLFMRKKYGLIHVITGSWFVGKHFYYSNKRIFMGRLFFTQFAEFKVDEWKITQGTPVIFESLKDNSIIEITNMENKIHKMTFRVGAKIIVDKFEGKFECIWNDNDLV
jgi:hypothetical protein